MKMTKKKLNRILTLLYEQQANMPGGIVVEVERVIAKGDDKVEWSKISVDDSLEIHSPDVGFERNRTAEIEIHYAFDIPKQGRWQNEPPLKLADLKKACLELEIYVGGWFLFEKGNSNKWAYRSNQFARVSMPREKVQEQRNKLDQYLARIGKQIGFESKVRALIEQIIGVWRTPLSPVDTKLRKSVRQLAEWEAQQDLNEFWVIAPNFLGDTRGDVRQAMISNLRNRVAYTYFLRSFADVQRLRKLAEMLEPDITGYADIFKLIRAVLLESMPEVERDFFEEEYFIANPDALDLREGYRLLRTGNGKIYAGERMKLSDFRKPDLLRDLIKQNDITSWMQIPLRRDSRKPRQKAVVCAKLNKAPGHSGKPNEENWEMVIGEFDQKIADTVSKLCGEVVKGSLATYFIIFDDVESALDCARQLQNDVKDCNRRLNSFRIPSPRVSLDFGHILKVMRSYGYDFFGQPISICDKLIKQINDGEILLTKAIEDNLSPTLKNQFKIGNPGTRAIEEFRTEKCQIVD